MYVGIAKAGKTTISDRLTRLLKSYDIPVKQIDGKKLAVGLCAKTPCKEHFVHHASEVAKLFTEEGYISIISVVAPLRILMINGHYATGSSGSTRKSC